MDSHFISQIFPDLYQGNRMSSMPHILQKYNIQTVVIFGYHPQKKLPNLDYHIYDIEDVPSSTENLLSIMPNLTKIIDKSIKEKKPVLISCIAGRSRSITALALYLYYCFQNANNKTNNNDNDPPPTMEEILRFIYSKKTQILGSYQELLMGINQGFLTMLRSPR